MNWLFRRRPRGDIYAVAARHRRSILRGEAESARTILAAWRRVERRILVAQMRVIRKIERAQAAGLEVSPAWLFQQERYFEYIAVIRSEAERFAALAEGVARAGQDRAVGLGVRHAGEAMRAVGVDAGFIRVPKEQLEYLVGMLGNGSPLEALFKTFGDQAAAKAKTTLIEGLGRGLNPRVIAKRLARAIGATPTRALLIARTETIRAYRMATLENYRANSEVVSGWRWTSARDKRTCPICLAMDGQEFSLEASMGTHPACRCAMTPINRYRPVSRGTGEEWLKKQPEDYQRQALGPGRWELWHRGDVALADLVKVTRSPEWGEGRALRPIAELAQNSSR